MHQIENIIDIKKNAYLKSNPVIVIQVGIPELEPCKEQLIFSLTPFSVDSKSTSKLTSNV